jgi:hypothetical protein
LLSIAVFPLSVIADVYRVESSTYIDTLALLKASGMSLVKIEKSKGPKELPWGIPDSTWIMLEGLPLKNNLCSIRQVTLYSQYSRGCKAITHTFFHQQTMIDNVKRCTEV